MWRKQEVHRDFFWIGVVAGFAIVGLVVVGFLLGTEMGRNTRTRWEKPFSACVAASMGQQNPMVRQNLRNHPLKKYI